MRMKSEIEGQLHLVNFADLVDPVDFVDPVDLDERVEHVDQV